MQFGRYHVVRQLGQGGMATVYEACDPKLNQRVAIKVMLTALASTPELVARFELEARIVNGIHHPGVVAVYELGKLRSGAVYYVMEYVDGETLAQRIARRTSLPIALEEVYRLTRQIADTLSAVHAHGIVHRDLKPENLMLVPDALVPGGVRVRTIDFGLAKVLNENARPLDVNTQVGTGLGTVDYIAPEQILDARNIDDRADVYSLGCVLFELASGRPPFVGETSLWVMGSHLTRCAPDLLELDPELPQPLAVLVANMLAKEPQQRPTMRQVVQRLDTMWAAWVRQGSDTVILRLDALPPPPLPQAVAPRPSQVPIRMLRVLGALTLGATAASLPLILLLQTCVQRVLISSAPPPRIERVQERKYQPPANHPVATEDDPDEVHRDAWSHLVHQ